MNLTESKMMKVEDELVIVEDKIDNIRKVTKENFGIWLSLHKKRVELRQSGQKLYEESYGKLLKK